MLSFYGKRRSFCDGMSRRNFLTIGGLALGGLTLPGLLKAESLAGTRATKKSIINIWLPVRPIRSRTNRPRRRKPRGQSSLSKKT